MQYRDFIIEHVSRETFLKLESFVDLIIKWNRGINLIAKGTEKEIWSRHIYDSFQLKKYIKDKTGNIVDIGAGGGFPGIVLSIVCNNRIVLIESDKRKAVFLEECCRVLNLETKVISARVEDQIDLEAEIVVSRACAPLNKLLYYSSRIMKQDGCCVFLKGKAYKEELSFASGYDFEYTAHESEVSDEGVVLVIQNLKEKL